MYRLFVAIDLPTEVKNRLLSVCYGLPGAKWFDESRLHITLRFVGEVDGGRFKDIVSSLGRINSEPFMLTISGLDVMPNNRAPESINAGVVACKTLNLLQKRVEKSLVDCGVPPSNRNYHPHVTIARLKNVPVSRLISYLSGNALLKLEPFEVNEFCLYSSFLSSQQAWHEVEAVYPLLRKRSIEDEKLS